MEILGILLWGLDPLNVGKTYLVSGHTLAVINVLNDPEFQLVQGQTFGGELGSSVAAAGDIDRDGTPDILVGVPHHVSVAGADEEELNSAGRAFVFSGATGGVCLPLMTRHRRSRRSWALRSRAWEMLTPMASRICSWERPIKTRKTGWPIQELPMSSVVRMAA